MKITTSHLKLFGLVMLGMIIWQFLFIPPTQIYYFIEYLETTPPITVIGQNMIFILTGILVTIGVYFLKKGVWKA